MMMTNAQKVTLEQLKAIFQADGPQKVIVTTAGTNIYAKYTAPITTAVVIFPNGNLCFVKEHEG